MSIMSILSIQFSSTCYQTVVGELVMNRGNAAEGAVVY
jgi:hypothetical protein